MVQRHTVTHAIRDAIARSKVGDSIRSLAIAEDKAAQDRAFEYARSLRNEGKKADAVEEFRRAATQYGPDAAAWRAYGRELIEVGQPEASYEAIKTSLDLDPSHVDTLELYFELHERRGGRAQDLVKVLHQFGEDLLPYQTRHDAAFEYCVQFSLDPVLNAMLDGPPGMARALAELNASLVEEPAGSPLEERAARIAERLGVSPGTLALRVAMARGRRTLALTTLRGMKSSEIPGAPLRRAIRREGRQRRLGNALPYIEQYLRFNPTDRWALGRRNQAELAYRESEQGRERKRLLSGNLDFGGQFPQRYSPETNRVFYLLHNSMPYDSAGYATRTHGLLSGLKSLGWKAEGVTRPSYPFDRKSVLEGKGIPPVDQVDGVNYHRLSTFKEHLPRTPIMPFVEEYTRRVFRLAEAERPFLIHAASNHWNGIAGVMAARRLGLPSIYEVRGLWEITRVSREPEWRDTEAFELMAHLETQAALGADRVFALTAALKDELVRRGVDSEKIVLLPNGVDSTRFVPKAPVLSLKVELGILNVPIIGYVGSILDYEGIDILLEACNLLRMREIEFHCLIVGDGDYLDQAIRLATSLRLDDHITFTGRVPHDEVEDYYSLIDIAPLPRKPLPVCEMVSPLKPFEAMAMGKVVIGSSVEAIAEIIVPGVNGLLHEKGNFESLAGVMGSLIAETGEVARLGASARLWVQAHRDWREISRIVDNTYEELGGVSTPY